MSSRLPKKLLHANYKKAWKFFKTKLTNLGSISTTVKRTKKYCSSAFSFIRRRYLDIPRKVQYAFTSSPRRRSSFSSAPYLFQQYYSQQSKCSRASFSAIYIDELFPEQSMDNIYTEMKKDDEIGSSGLKKAEKPQKGNGNTAHETGESSSAAAATSGGGAVSGNGRRKLPMLPQFRGVDERAEEFISKFRKEMKLEREKSIIDFQEMLARSS